MVAKLAAELLVEAVDAESKNLDLVGEDFGKFDEYLDQVVEDFEQVCEHFGPDDYVKAESGLGRNRAVEPQRLADRGLSHKCHSSAAKRAAGT